MRGRETRGPETDRWQRRDWWGVVLEAPDPHLLLAFWSAILDRPIWRDDDDGGSLDLGEGVGYLSVQRAEVYEPPVWPPQPGRPGMQLHLDIEVSDLDAAVDHALELGATLADAQPQDDVRVLLDPAGHPFCLYT
jgi:Glyoxalase-like domain